MVFYTKAKITNFKRKNKFCKILSKAMLLDKINSLIILEFKSFSGELSGVKWVLFSNPYGVAVLKNLWVLCYSSTIHAVWMEA